MGIIAWIVLGLIAGAIAKAILPGDDPGSAAIDIAHRKPNGQGAPGHDPGDKGD